MATDKNNNNNNGDDNDDDDEEELLAASLVAPPDIVYKYEQLDELARAYGVSAPYVARTRCELAFDVYDGRKLSASVGHARTDSCRASSDNSSAGQQQQQVNAPELTDSAPPAEQLAFEHQFGHAIGPRSTTTQKHAAKHGHKHNKHRHEARAALPSWCRLLAFRRAQATCCLRPSDTSGELATKFASSQQSLSQDDTQEARQRLEPVLARALDDWDSSAAASALACGAHPLASGEERAEAEQRSCEAAELCGEAMRLVRPLLLSMRRDSTLAARDAALTSRGVGSSAAASNEAPAPASTPEAQQQQLDSLSAMATTCDGLANSLQATDASSRVSICLLDKKHIGACGAERPPAEEHAWARVRSRVRALRCHLRWAPARERSATAERLEAAVRTEAHSSHTRLAGGGGNKRAAARADKLVELAKTSLNQLIDAQLLLRNKLAAEQYTQTGDQQQQQQQQLLSTHKAHECDLLLRNNFNLLRIWQNLEESKQLACFVCEPIKSSLADLFAFNRRRLEASALWWPPQNNVWLASPFVCLTAAHVKCGLIQVSIVC